MIYNNKLFWVTFYLRLNQQSWSFYMLEAQKSQRGRQISRLVLLLLLSMGTTTSFSGLFCFRRTASCFITQSFVNSLITKKPCRSCTSSCPIKLHCAAIRKTHSMGGTTEHRPTSRGIRWNPELTWDSTGCVCAGSMSTQHLPAGCNMPQNNHFTSIMLSL